MFPIKVDKLKQNPVFISILKWFFIAQIFFGVALSFWILFENQPKTGDDVEHLHSAWLVSQGKIPYKDFFQHHNPLLWYMFAPVMQFFAYDIIVFDVVRIFSTLMLFLNLFYVGLIVKRFMVSNSVAALIGIASVFPSYVIYSGQDFRPDNYMILTFTIALYYFLSYIEDKRLKDLVISFFMFTVSFFFMQKNVFTLVVVIAVIVYLLSTHKMPLPHFAKAVIIPLLMVLSFVLWLYHHDLFKTYWMSNYIFNLYIPDVYGNLVEQTHEEFYVVLGFAFLGFIYFAIYGNLAQRVVCLLWLLEVVQRLFYFSIDRHYYYQLQTFNAILAGSALWIIVKKYNFASLIIVILSLVGCYTFCLYCQKLKIAPGYHRYVTPKYVLEQTNRCDSVINGAGITYGIFSKDVTYYWNLNGQLDVIGNKLGIAPLPDLNKAIRENLPKIIYTRPYWHEKLRQQKRKVHVHLVEDSLRDTYYEQSIFVGVHILKQEYQDKRRCRYDAKTKSWNYYEVK